MKYHERQVLVTAFLATWEAEIQRIAVIGKPGQIVHEAPPPK
jgi:hypothetical protein